MSSNVTTLAAANATPSATLEDADAAASPGFAEPLLCANLYGADPDRLLGRVLAPMWRGLRRERPDFPGFLWFHRHDARAPHLKVFLHAPGELRDELVTRLEDAVEEAGDELRLDTTSDASEVPKRRAFDALDRGGSPPSSPLELTDFSRHASLFGVGKGLVSHPEYASAYFTCLGLAAELVLEHFDPDAEDLRGQRQNLLFLALGHVLSSAFEDDAERARYVHYHFSWIVRFLVLWSGHGSSKAHEVLGTYRAQSKALPPKVYDTLGALASAGPSSGASGGGERAERFSSAFTALRDAARGHASPGDSGDPFAGDSFDPSVLQILHLVANQLGVAKLDEGFSHYIVWRALSGRVDASASPDPTGDFSLAPLWDDLDARAEDDSDEGTFTHQTAAFEESYDWAGFALLGCDDEAWRSLFAEEGQRVVALSGQGLTALRRMRLEEGKALLDRAAEARRRLADLAPSMYEGVGRFYFGSLAYYHYLVGDHEKAEATLDEARDSVSRAIFRDDFLLPMAPLVTDIPLQKARVARRQGRWHEMERHLRRLRALQEGDEPLCVLEDGRAVTFETLGEHFEAQDLSGLTPEQRQAIDELLDPAVRQREFRRRYAELYVHRYKLLPYP